MITEKDLEKAADKYEAEQQEKHKDRDNHDFDNYRDGFVDGLTFTYDAFKDGANWQRNRVWHDSDKEQPEDNRTVVVWNPAIKDGEILTFCVEVFEHRLWAYIEDILPAEILKFSNS